MLVHSGLMFWPFSLMIVSQGTFSDVILKGESLVLDSFFPYSSSTRGMFSDKQQQHVGMCWE